MPSATEMSTVSARFLRYINQMNETKHRDKRQKDRLARQAEALRANLRRRKEQARRRDLHKGDLGSAPKDLQNGNENSFDK